MLDILIALFLFIGGAFALIGSIGLARLPDLFMRLHGPTKATTLGVGGILIASVLHFSSRGDGLSLHELLITLFLFITAPISAYLIARTMLHLRGDNKS
ncbi:Na+/H+ antiporter subunit G [Sulfurivermis fontis]|uniref:Na+/H+ antiporter subunit G n=1 Tax=Sulfurivermis fontis TaxID=1972068 RepID=UPI000FD7E368|nr:Na+/H+ antiporter subunit G [Sulfurivermis fontis]